MDHTSLYLVVLNLQVKVMAAIYASLSVPVGAFSQLAAITIGHDPLGLRRQLPMMGSHFRPSLSIPNPSIQ
jgi:hypothetical protein